MNTLFLYNFTNLLPLLPIVFVVLFFVVPPFYKEGRNQYLYLQKTADNKYFLIIITNFLSVYMGKGGSSEKHRYRIKKIDLETGALVYIQKIINVGAGFLEGYLNVIGVAGDYIFVTTKKNKLLIIDLKNGELVADKRKLLAANSDVIDFSMEGMKINPKSGFLECYNIEGKLFEIDPSVMAIRPPSERLVEQTNNYCDVYDGLPFFEARDYYWSLRFEDKDIEYDLKWEQVADNKRYMVKMEPSIHTQVWKKNLSVEKFEYHEKSTSFIRPKFLARYSDIIFLKNPYRFLIEHQAFLDGDQSLNNKYLSLITGASEQLWQRRYSELVHKSLHNSTEHKLYVELGENLIWLFFAYSSATRLSVAAVQTDTGMVVMEPMLVKNTWWEKKKM